MVTGQGRLLFLEVAGLTVFEYLACTAPWVLIGLESMGLLDIHDYLPVSTAKLMRHAAYRRIRRRLRQVRSA